MRFPPTGLRAGCADAFLGFFWSVLIQLSLSSVFAAFWRCLRALSRAARADVSGVARYMPANRPIRHRGCRFGDSLTRMLEPHPATCDSDSQSLVSARIEYNNFFGFDVRFISFSDFDLVLQFFYYLRTQLTLSPPLLPLPYPTLQPPISGTDTDDGEAPTQSYVPSNRGSRLYSEVRQAPAADEDNDEDYETDEDEKEHEAAEAVEKEAGSEVQYISNGGLLSNGASIAQSPVKKVRAWYFSGQWTCCLERSPSFLCHPLLDTGLQAQGLLPPQGRPHLSAGIPGMSARLPHGLRRAEPVVG